MKKLLSIITVLTAALLLGSVSVPSGAFAASGSNILVVYFSCTNTTEGVAQSIQAATGADIYEITPEEPYTSADLNYNNSSCRANREQNDFEARPAISGELPDMSKYDAVFVGYPIWWGKLPKIIYTFFESADLSGKTIIPFCTSGGSGISTSVNEIKALEPNADVQSGRRFASGTSQSTVKAWVDTLALPEAATAPTITVTENTITVNDAPDGAALITAVYFDGALSEVYLNSVEGDATENVPSANGDRLKVFLWDMNALAPLCEPYEINITK